MASPVADFYGCASGGMIAGGRYIGLLVDWDSATIGTPTSGWTVEKDVTRKWGNRTSLKITSSAGAADTLSCTITIPNRSFSGSRIAFAVDPGNSYITGDTDNPIQLRLNYSAGSSHNVQMTVGINHAVAEWFDSGALCVGDTSGHINGTPVWDKVANETVTTITLVMTKRAGQAISVPAYIGPIVSNPISIKPTLTIFMDGNYSGQYSIARGILNARNLKASLAVVVPWMNTRNMTTGQLQTMYAEGHEAICHTGTSGDFGWDSTSKYPDGSEYALVKADIEAAWAYLSANNMPRGIGRAVVGFTNGLVNTQTQARRTNISNALRDAGATAIRQLGGYSGSYYGNQGERQTVVAPSFMVQNAHSVGDVTAIIDKLIAAKGWSALTYHNVASTGGGNDVSTANFTGAMDYIAAKLAANELQVLTFSDAMPEINGRF